MTEIRTHDFSRTSSRLDVTRHILSCLAYCLPGTANQCLFTVDAVKVLRRVFFFSVPECSLKAGAVQSFFNRLHHHEEYGQSLPRWPAGPPTGEGINGEM